MNMQTNLTSVVVHSVKEKVVRFFLQFKLSTDHLRLKLRIFARNWYDLEQYNS